MIDMDEDEFRKLFMKKSVFREVSSLDFSYVPEKLLCRDESIERLISNYRHIIEYEESSTNCLLLGRAGIGKTLSGRYFGRMFKNVALEYDVDLFVEYYNCIYFRSKSKIIRELLAKYTHEPRRRLSDEEALKLILTKLINENTYMLLIIDDVHLLKPADVLALLSIAETFGHQNTKLSVLLICRNHDWMKIENERILSRLDHIIRLKPYNYEETFQILEYRAWIAFKEHVISKDLIEMVSDITAGHRNIHNGIYILRESGLTADKEGGDRITADMIRDASNEAYPTFRADIIDRLANHELLALYGITASLLHKDEAFTVVDEAYEEYQTICEIYGVEPHVKGTFRKYVRTLNDLEIIKSTIYRIEGTERGRQLEITLLDISAEKLEEVLIDIFEKKFG